MSKTSSYHENGGLSSKFFEKFEFRKKNAVKNETKILKNSFYAIFHNKLYFFISNVNLESFQLSFDILVVHTNQQF